MQATRQACCRDIVTRLPTAGVRVFILKVVGVRRMDREEKFRGNKKKSKGMVMVEVMRGEKGGGERRIIMAVRQECLSAP